MASIVGFIFRAAGNWFENSVCCSRAYYEPMQVCCFFGLVTCFHVNATVCWFPLERRPTLNLLLECLQFQMANQAVPSVETRLQAFDVLTQRALAQMSLWSGWPGAFIKDNERAETLKMLVRLALFGRRTGDSALNTAEFAALRLAATNVFAVGRQPRVRAIIRHFEDNLKVLQRSWVLQAAMPDRLRLSPLGELSVVDLMELRRCLKHGWMQEYDRSAVGVQPLQSQIWVTPASRA